MNQKPTSRRTQFVSGTLIAALELDALENSHPIEVEVGHPSEVDEIFDNISYNKGASVIRMLHNYIGNDAFRKGMNAYLTQHSYKNTQTEDLWRALTDASQVRCPARVHGVAQQVGLTLILPDQQFSACSSRQWNNQSKVNPTRPSLKPTVSPCNRARDHL